MRVNRLFSILVLLLAVLSGANAWGACTLATTGVNFGAYDVFNLVDTDSTGTITVNCTTRTMVTAIIGPSTASGVMAPRQMRHATGVEVLGYNLFTQANRQNVWGDGTVGTKDQKQNVRPNRPWVATVFARVFAGQDVTSGLYDDTVTVTILP